MSVGVWPHPPTMKLILSSCACVSIVLSLLVNAALALDPTAVAGESQANATCPVSNKPVNPAITFVY